jgi:hypothetical protein
LTSPGLSFSIMWRGTGSVCVFFSQRERENSTMGLHPGELIYSLPPTTSKHRSLTKLTLSHTL